MWCYNPLTNLWARAKSPLAPRRVLGYPTPHNKYPWIGTVQDSMLVRRSRFPNQVFFVNGVGYTSDLIQAPAPSPEIWIATVNIRHSLAPAFVPRLPQLEPGQIDGMKARWFTLPTCQQPDILALAASPTSAAITDESGVLLRYEFGPPDRSQTPGGFRSAASPCFAVQLTGYLWNPSPATNAFRFHAIATSGIQVEWGSAGQFAFLMNDTWLGARPYSNHSAGLFFSGSSITCAHVKFSLSDPIFIL